MDETYAGLKDHDAVEEALIVRIRSACEEEIGMLTLMVNSQLIGSSFCSPREGKFHRDELKREEVICHKCGGPNHVAKLISHLDELKFGLMAREREQIL